MAAHALDDSQTLTLAAGDPGAAAQLPTVDAARGFEVGTASTPCTWTGVPTRPITLTF